MAQGVLDGDGVRTCMCVDVHVYVYMCMCICMCSCVRMCMCIYVSVEVMRNRDSLRIRTYLSVGFLGFIKKGILRKHSPRRFFIQIRNVITINHAD